MLKKKNIVKVIGTIVLCLLLSGCEKENFLQQEEAFRLTKASENKEFSGPSEDTSGEEDKESSAVTREGSEPEDKESSLATKEGSEPEDKESSLVTKEGSGTKAKKDSANTEEGLVLEEQGIVVHICGAVNQAGVYFLKENSRLYEGIHKAGGFRQDAHRDYLNQAMILEDGMKITVPTQAEIEQEKKQEENQISGATTEGNSSNVTEKTEGYIQSSIEAEESALQLGFLQKKDVEKKNNDIELNRKVNLNTADQELLCTLPGIGESRAKSIIAYRKEHGLFQKIEDVMKISGIKEAAFEKIKDYIIVSE